MKSARIVTCVAIAFAALAAASLKATPLAAEYIVDGDSGVPGLPPRVPEGVSYDLYTNTFFATAIFGGRISRIDGATGAETTFYQETENPFISFAGIKVDLWRRLVWVAATDLVSDPNGPLGYVYVFRLSYNQQQGQLLKKFALPAPFFCNDVAIDLNGNGFLTDSFGATVYRIQYGALWGAWGDAEPFATSASFLPDFSQPGAIGQNGIAVTPNNQYVILAKSVPSKLYRINLNNPYDILEIQFTGDAFGQDPADPSDDIKFLAADGLVFLNGKLYVSYHQGVQELSFNANYSVANVKSTTDVPSGLSTATVAQGNLYVIDSEVVPVTQPQLGLPVLLPNKIVKVDLGAF